MHATNTAKLDFVFCKKLSPDGVSLTMVGNNQMVWLYVL